MCIRDRTGMEEMRAGTAMISNASDQLQALAVEMQKAIDSIGNELGQFKV